MALASKDIISLNNYISIQLLLSEGVKALSLFLH